MVIRPKADETYEIVYNIQNTESWDMYAQALDKFLSRKFGSFPPLQWVKFICCGLSNDPEWIVFT